MSQPLSQMGLLSTKLQAPPVREKWVVWTRLVHKLNSVVNQKLTLICASAGYGKTTLLNHRSIVVQEYGIPAVLGTGDATKRIHNGLTITVDGNAGMVILGKNRGSGE